MCGILLVGLVISNAFKSENMYKIVLPRQHISYFTCSKTVLMLPNYLAQISYRSLKKSEKHSDVSITAYTSPEINMVYYDLYVPSSILQQIGLISNTGLFEWWPKFINRYDFSVVNENLMPTKPNMSGDILVLFAFLAGGVSLATSCLVLEV